MNNRNTIRALRVLSCFALLAFFTSHPLTHADETPAPVKALTEEAQKTFLAKRTNPYMRGRFDSFCSQLWALYNVGIHTESHEVNETLIRSLMPPFYKPTWREVFDNIAMQTQSAWSYDPTRNFWVFTRQEKPKTYYEVELAKDWSQKGGGFWTEYITPSALDVMDIYYMGSFSSDNPAEADEWYKNVRESFAMFFYKDFDGDATQLQEVDVNTYKALHFSMTATDGFIWRKWVLMEDGKVFVILSAIKPEQDAEIYPDVQKMINTFKIVLPISTPNHQESPS